ncbi:two-component sensor PilS [Burkholderiales bacterium GJ-E10]|nr:two-component sensor PilS [Burkholderiales bacterium GJ-E10]
MAQSADPSRAADAARGETAGLVVRPVWQALRALSLVRVAAAVFALVFALLFSVPVEAGGSAGSPHDVTAVLGVYCVLAMILAAMAVLARRHFTAQLSIQFSVDLLFATVLVVLSGGIRSEFAVFYLLPVAGASVILPTGPAFFISSIAVVVLLADAFLRSVRQGQAGAQLFEAGLFGAALFGITALLRLLATRLRRQETLAHVRGVDLHSQLEINRLVISQMEQGVLVVDAATQVRANNIAARVFLGLDRGAQLTGRRLDEFPALATLVGAYRRWLSSPVPADERPAQDEWVFPAPPGAESGAGETPRPLRARFARPPTSRSGEFVIFLEDLRAIEDRAQRLKLAAMGRLTASIAHEIRNPLGAIGNAGQLLAEEALTPLQRRLVEIVRENTARLNRLVEDVLRVARRDPPMGDALDARRFVETWADEFQRDRAVPEGVLAVEGAIGAAVVFEPGHLRQILFNLVDNAVRYASGKPGCVRIVLREARAEDPAQIWVLDDGPGVPPAERAAIFEPFFTSRAKGTGLGLYLAREFCIANGAELVYDLFAREDGVDRCGFAVRFVRGAAEGAMAEEPLETIQDLEREVRWGD